MNAGLPPINLADAFGPQARTDQLAGLLPPKTPTVTSSPKKATPPPAEETPARERTARRAPTTPKAKVGRARGVIVYVTVSQREWLRTHISTDRTVTDVVLDALEAHVHTLAPTTPATSTEGLFTRSTRPTPHNGVQVQLRLTPANLDVLDQLVRDRNFPSRSALIRAALAAAEQA